MDPPETNSPASSKSEVSIEKWVYGGRGLGRIEGLAVLVPYVLPGETARIEARRLKPGLVEAKLLEVAGPSSSRIQPECPYFTRCGGCHYQHAPYEFQLAQKVLVLREVFRRIGKLEAPEEIAVLSGPPWQYRNRTRFHLAFFNIGFHEAGSHALCPIERCPISSPRVNDALATLGGMLRDRRFPQFVKSIELFANESEVQLNVLEAGRPVARQFFDWCAETIPGAAAGSLEYQAAGEIFRVGHRSFFQVNRFLIDGFVDCALEEAAGGWAADLYAGVGLFSLPLARRIGNVSAIEAANGAFRDLEFNASRAGLKVDARRTTADQFLSSLEQPPDFLLADPPRAGLGKTVVRELLRLKAPRLTIVSCDPATLARDLAPLAASGYRIVRLALVDLFPQTYHIETVTQLRLGS